MSTTVTVNGLFCTIIATSGFQASTVTDFTIFCLKIATAQISKMSQLPNKAQLKKDNC